MIKCKIKYLKFFLTGVGFLLFTNHLWASNNLNQYFKFEADGQHADAQKILNDWKPTSFEEEAYKKYFIAIKERKIEMFWDLYQDLSKVKKLIILQFESIRSIIEIDLESHENQVKKLNKFSKIAKTILKRMRSQPEGVKYEYLYLKWVLKNKNFKELCRAERSGWLSQTNLKLSEVMQGLETCPVSYDDFIYRMRMLVFSGEEKIAKSEIDEFSSVKKLTDWEKAYLQAIYFSNIGDPTAAYEVIIPYESIIKTFEDYYINLFYIAQRAGELAKAEEIIEYVINKSSIAIKIKELLFQKSFLYYQTRRYKEAIKILTSLIESNPSHRKKIKSSTYDNLTWLQAWCYYLDKDFVKARDLLTKNKKWTSDKARNLYWLAQSEWALDNPSTALSYFRELALPVLTGNFFSYYNYLSWLRFESYKNTVDMNLLKEQINNIKVGHQLYALPDFSTNPQSLIKAYEFYFEDVGATDEGNSLVADQEQKIQNLKETVGIQTNSTAELVNEMSWADDLIKWGYRDLAKWHLYEVEKNLGKKSSAEPLIEYYTKNEYYNRALSLTNSISSPAGKKLNRKEDPLLWSSLFPRAYRSFVEKEAEKRKIHPYLLWSIMKAETQYKSDAISPVGAIGLMQFMPYTSQKVALLLNEEYQNNKLFEPESAIKYGAMYLKKLSDELGGQLPLVAAAYNGGPHRVKLWLKKFIERDNTNMDYDVFIEHIPFAETRTYVKRVLSYNLIYQKLYDDKLDAKLTKWIIEKIPFKLQEPIVLKEEWPVAAKR